MNQARVIDLKRRLRSPTILFFYHGEELFWGKSTMFRNSRKELEGSCTRTVILLLACVEAPVYSTTDAHAAIHSLNWPRLNPTE